MRILVTGGAGFIGSNLVHRLLRCGHEILNIDKLTYAGNLQSLTGVQNNPRYQFLQADIVDGFSMGGAFEAFRPQAVMHLAAESHVDRSIDGPMQFFETNLIGTVNLLSRSLEFWKSLSLDEKEKFRFVHVSTDEVYGSLSKTGLFTESTAYDPHSPYSASKAASDHAARAWFHTYGLPVIVTNCSNNYGPFQFPEKLIPVVILKCLRQEPIPVYGKGENVRDWLYVEDHCRALEVVLEQGTTGETYNIGGSNELQNIDLVRMLCGILDDLRPSQNGRPYDELITFVDDRPGHDLRYAIDASKITNELGWIPKQGHESGFRNTVLWYLDNQAWWQNIISGSYQLERQGTGFIAHNA